MLRFLNQVIILWRTLLKRASLQIMLSSQTVLLSFPRNHVLGVKFVHSIVGCLQNDKMRKVYRT